MWFKHSCSRTNEQADLDQSLFKVIVARAVILLAGIHLSDRLDLLPDRLGELPFTSFFNVLTISLTILYLICWRVRRMRLAQLYFQIVIDLVLATILVASARGIEGPFVSFYLLIIIYCSLTLGKNGGMLGGALSALCYAGIVIATRLGVVNSTNTTTDVSLEVFKICFHTLGFGAVAYLGTYLHQRLSVMEGVLREKNDSLEKLQRLNEHIVSSIRSGLITMDMEGKIAGFNAAARELTGRDQKEVIGTFIHLIIGEKFWNLIQETDLSKNIQPLRHEEWIRQFDNSLKYLGFSVSPLLDHECRQLGYIISFQDLSEIIRLEKEVRLRERMAAVGRMAAGIAHEIRNPLTAMRGSAEILRAHANLPPKDERLLNILISESDRLNSFIEDFFDFAHPKPRKKADLDLVPVLKDAVALLKNSPEFRVKYVVDLNIMVQDMFIHGNVDQLRQVFWNVTQNARRAMPDGGTLVISVGVTSEGMGTVVFADSGVGMTQEEIEQLFQPFHSKFPKGLGLGLSIIFQIMEDHCGRIAVESEKGKGTRVMLSFPLEVGLTTAKPLLQAVGG